MATRARAGRRGARSPPGGLREDNEGRGQRGAEATEVLDAGLAAGALPLPTRLRQPTVSAEGYRGIGRSIPAGSYVARSPRRGQCAKPGGVALDLSRAIDVTVEYEGVSQRLLVTRLAPRVFRLEEAVLLADDPLDCGDIVEGTLVGDSLHITRRLRKTRFVRHDFILSAELIAAPALRELKDRIMEEGGNWEQLFQGVFVVYLPSTSALDVRGELSRIATEVESAQPDTDGTAR